MAVQAGVEEKGQFWHGMERGEARRGEGVKSSRVESSIAGLVSGQLALVLRRLGERVRVGFGLFCLVLR